jgi:hypothetical protein
MFLPVFLPPFPFPLSSARVLSNIDPDNPQNSIRQQVQGVVAVLTTATQTTATLSSIQTRRSRTATRAMSRRSKSLAVRPCFITARFMQYRTLTTLRNSCVYSFFSLPFLFTDAFFRRRIAPFPLSTPSSPPSTTFTSPSPSPLSAFTASPSAPSPKPR